MCVCVRVFTLLYSPPYSPANPSIRCVVVPCPSCRLRCPLAFYVAKPQSLGRAFRRSRAASERERAAGVVVVVAPTPAHCIISTPPPSPTPSRSLSVVVHRRTCSFIRASLVRFTRPSIRSYSPAARTHSSLLLLAPFLFHTYTACRTTRRSSCRATTLAVRPRSSRSSRRSRTCRSPSST